jgi:hypothetical protein
MAADQVAGIALSKQFDFSMQNLIPLALQGGEMFAQKKDAEAAKQRKRKSVAARKTLKTGENKT